MEKITISYFRKVYKQFVDEEITMSKMVQLLNAKAIEESNRALRSCKSVAERKGKGTHWDEFDSMLNAILNEQHGIMYGS